MKTMQKLIITATIPLPSDPLAASKLQTSALEAGEAFKKALAAVDKKAEYEAKIVRVRADDEPKPTRVKKTAAPAADLLDKE